VAVAPEIPAFHEKQEVCQALPSGPLCETPSLDHCLQGSKDNSRRQYMAYEKVSSGFW
jgi:hypothetical protein